MTRSGARATRSLLFGVATFALAIAVVEGVAFTAILALNAAAPETPIVRNAVFFAEQASRMRALLEESRPGTLGLDAELGWRPLAGIAGHDDFNAQSLRSSHEYASAPPPGVLRIAAFGDSFVYGAEVATADSWPARMEALDASVEVLNYGVNAYGVDQVYLRYLAEGAALAPQVVILGFYDDDLARLVSVYRPFRSPVEQPLAKPRFVLTDDGALRLLPNPLPPPVYREVAQDPTRLLELRAHDHWYRRLVFENPLYDVSASVRLLTTLGYQLYERDFDPERVVDIPNRWLGRDGPWRYRRSAEAYRIQIALVEAFTAAVHDRGAVPIVVVFPTKGLMRTAFEARTDLAYAPLVEDLEARGTTVLDVADAILELGSKNDIEGYFQPHQHYSPRANNIVARWLSRRVREVTARGRG